MSDHLKFLWQISLLAAILVLAGILVLPAYELELSVYQFLGMCASFVLINLLAWFISVRGVQKGQRDGAFVLLAALGVKFLLYLVYILVFWGLTKNLSKAFIIAFFTLYLIFTFFTAGRLLKLLKTK